MIGSNSNYVEHPELVAQRIVRYANVLGRERVMAGTDCGFGTFAGFGPVFPAFSWMKFRSLAEGARIASEKTVGKGWFGELIQLRHSFKLRRVYETRAG